MTLSYALFFMLLCGGIGMAFRAFLDASQNANLRENINQEWAVLKGFLRIHNGMLYSTLAGDTPDEVRAVIRRGEPAWKVRRDAGGAAYLIRSGVLYSNDRSRDPYFVSIGRPLAGDQRIIRQLTLAYALLIPIVLVGSWLIAGFALRPVAPERQV